MDLLENVREAGVVGAGGAGFPTHTKINSKAEYILLNGAECEPLLRVDQQLMEIYSNEIIKGLELAGRYVNANKAIIGIKGKHKNVIKILKNVINELCLDDYISVKELADVYPAGDEQVLVYELTGRIVPEGGIPLHVGCIVLNSETVLNIYNASNCKPVTKKYITISGDIPNRLTVRVPVGTPIIDVLRLSGVENFNNYAIIDGGPMMGSVIDSIDGYVTKKNKGFIILKKEHYLIRKKSIDYQQAKKINKSSCEQCRMCTDICPRYLLGHNLQPHKMVNAMNYKLDNGIDQINAFLCCQCNLCELFSCPAGLHPKFANLYFKSELVKSGITYQKSKDEFLPHKSREYRQVPSKRLIGRLGLLNFDKPAPISDLDLKPECVYIATNQHVGAPAIANVVVGEHVDIGQKIGDIPKGSLGATIHSSISGTVIKVDDNFIVIKGD